VPKKPWTVQFLQSSNCCSFSHFIAFKCTSPGAASIFCPALETAGEASAGFAVPRVEVPVQSIAKCSVGLNLSQGKTKKTQYNTINQINEKK
jgi:hypothetical protein